MRIVLDESNIPTLEDPDNFAELLVEVRGRRDLSWLAAAIATLGRPTSTDLVFLDPPALPQLAGSRASTKDWQDRYEKMIEYARDHGWVDGDGTIQVHVKWTE